MNATVHGSCVLLGEGGLLILGASGAGKSSLVQALLSRWRGRNDYAALVGDDRLVIEAKNGRLLARSHPRIAGLLEMRGIGIVKMSHEPRCVLRACIELTEHPGERLPDSDSLFRMIEGVKLPSATISCQNWLVDRVETFWFQTYL